MNPFDKLQHGIPPHEAAAFFLKLKTANYAPPDETGELEGQFAAPVDQVLAHMANMVQNELKTQYAYITYANSLRDLSHHAIAQELEQHADMETEHAEWLLRRMGVLGGPINVPDIPAPPPATDPHEIIQILIRMEQEGIQNWRALRDMVGDENPSKFKIEEYLTHEQEHLDELWQLVPHTENQLDVGAQVEPGELAAKPEQAQKTAAAVERFHPDTLRYHGAAMKLALASMTPTVFVPNIDLEGNLKEASVKRAEMPAAASLGDAAQGKHQPAMPPPALQGAAAGQLPKMAAYAEKFKRAFDEMTNTNALPAPGGQEEAELQQYLQQEQEGAAAEGEAEQAFYKQKFEAALQELQAAQQQSQAAQEQVQQLQAQVDQGTEMQTQALQQAQQIQEQAMQQATAANTAAAAAMQKTLAAQQEQLQQQQLAVGMRDAVQGIKTQVLNMVQTELPPATTMEAGMSAAADQAHADAQAQQEAEAAMAQQAGGQPAENQAGQPAASGDAGTPPGAPSPGGQGPDSSPNNAQTTNQPADGAKTTTQSGQSEETPKAQSEEKSASDRFIGALLGGALGAGSTAIESQMSNDPLRSKVHKLEAAEQAGEGGFGNALNLAQAKMRLALGELTEKHPIGATLAGGALGAMSGVQAAPHVREIVKSIRG